MSQFEGFQTLDRTIHLIGLLNSWYGVLQLFQTLCMSKFASCVSFTLPGDTLQYFFFILVQTYSKGCVFSTTDLHLIHFHFCHIQLLQIEGPQKSKYIVLNY